MEEINLSDITMNGESLQPTEATQSQGAVEEQPQNDQQVEPETEEQLAEETSSTEETFDDDADIADSETVEEVPVDDDVELSNINKNSEESSYSNEDIESVSSFIDNYTNNTYSNVDELVDAHDILFDQVEDLKAQLEQKTVEPAKEYDEFLQGLIDYYETTGDVTPYLEAKSVDYTKMSDLDIMRHEMRKQYPEVSDKNFERLFDREVIQKFQLDDERYGEDEVELGKELLKTDARRKRQSLIENQAKFAIPEREDNSEKAQADAEAAREQWIQTVQSHPVTKDIIDNQRVVIDYNGDSFAYEIDNTDSVVEMTIDNSKFFQLFQSEEGQVDYDKWYRVLNYASDPQTFERSLINHGKNLGGKEVVKEIKNPSRPRRASSSVSGDTNEEFLKAALNALGR